MMCYYLNVHFQSQRVKGMNSKLVLRVLVWEWVYGNHIQLFCVRNAINTSCNIRTRVRNACAGGGATISTILYLN